MTNIIYFQNTNKIKYFQIVSNNIQYLFDKMNPTEYLVYRFVIFDLLFNFLRKNK